MKDVLNICDIDFTNFAFSNFRGEIIADSYLRNRNFTALTAASKHCNPLLIARWTRCEFSLDSKTVDMIIYILLPLQV